MQISFEHFAVSEMMGDSDQPPRANGTLCFASDWERTALGLALALAKQGCFEWDEFRDELIAQIAAWENADPAIRPAWNYYDQFAAALQNAVATAGILEPEEIRTTLTACLSQDGRTPAN